MGIFSSETIEFIDVNHVRMLLPFGGGGFPVFVMVPGLTFSWPLKYQNRLKSQEKVRYFGLAIGEISFRSKVPKRKSKYW